MFELNIRRPPTYDPVAVQPFREELTYVGFEECLAPEAVDKVLKESTGTVLMMVNSVCGCAAGSARPGVALALQHNIIPDRLVTVFAGMEKDAVDRLRDTYLSEYPPSSPFIAMFQNAKPIFVLQRFQVERRYPQEIAQYLTEAFNQHCTRQGPSIPREKYDALVHAQMCGSKIPKFDQQ